MSLDDREHPLMGDVPFGTPKGSNPAAGSHPVTAGTGWAHERRWSDD